jgi:EAL domain-containing protein (putative c-di-GMP-specific phosphodiesterase class I)/CHASE2 domain-containing sensor protein
MRRYHRPIIIGHAQKNRARDRPFRFANPFLATGSGEHSMKTLFASFRRTPLPGRFPVRLLLWSLVVAALFGALGVAEPVENLLRIGRNWARSHAASGNVVIAGIDDATIAASNVYPLPRDMDAQMIDQLLALGANRVFVDLDFPTASKPAEDKAMAETIARHPGKIVLAGRFFIDSTTGSRTDALPIPLFSAHADVANINFRYDRSGAVWKLPYAMTLKGHSYPSFAAKIAGIHGAAGTMFPVDYAIDPRSVPLISAIDILRGRAPRAAIAGKDVILATRTDQVQDMFFVPGYGRFSGAYFHALGAETLRAGTPIDAGWLVPFALATAILLGTFALKRAVPIIITLAVASIAILLIPFELEKHLIFVDIVPALTLMAIPMCMLAWREVRARFKARSMTNALSGLRNLNALRLETVELDRLLVVARVHNFAEVIATLPAEAEKTLSAQIAARLTLGAPGLELYQGDDGVFAWFTGEEGESLGGHLSALYSLFRSPAVIAGTNVDLVVTFGVDSGRDRSIANRLGSALVAASEATAEGVKWKEFDASKLKDAAWKLSLLSQLDAAIDGGDLWVAYQPKLDLATNRITGAEALVRWTHPEKGAISPMEFVIAAEQHNRIEKLTMHVLERAITTAAAINAHGIHFGIAVNLSVRLLEDDNLADVIMAQLAKQGLDPSLLTLEITETAAMSAQHGMAILRDLRDRGIRVSIDDYGTGLSTLEYLKKIPASEIKIDKTFIQSMTDSPSDLLMVNSTIQLAHSLGHVVVAEGVELASTLERLIEMNCDTAQGYLIGRPMTFQALTRRLLSERRRAA